MTKDEEIKRLKLIAHYARIKLIDNGLYSTAIQIGIGLRDIEENKPISNSLDTIVNFYLKSDA